MKKAFQQLKSLKNWGWKNMAKLSEGSNKIYGEAAFEVLAKAQELERQTHYVPSIGLLELRKAVQDEIENTRGYRPDLEQVVITPGLKPGIFFSMLATVNPGDEVIYQDPGYPTYGSVSSFLGAKGVLVPKNN